MVQKRSVGRIGFRSGASRRARATSRPMRTARWPMRPSLVP